MIIKGCDDYNLQYSNPANFIFKISNLFHYCFLHAHTHTHKRWSCTRNEHFPPLLKEIKQSGFLTKIICSSSIFLRKRQLISLEVMRDTKVMYLYCLRVTFYSHVAQNKDILNSLGCLLLLRIFMSKDTPESFVLIAFSCGSEAHISVSYSVSPSHSICS